jgi:Na+-transporting NADH:ubiquinone oxidoreductase subunit NqrB
VLATQLFCDRLVGGPPFRLSARSALISGLSLCLLLRTNRPELAVLAAVITIASKSLVRVRGKHVFNPTNGGIVAMLLLTDQVWVSPGQWGAAAVFAFLMACAGMLVVHRSARSDVTYAFIALYSALLFGRSLSLGEPLTIPLHRLQSGALLLFTFFMISDPKTTPDSRTGRVLFAALVAFGAWYVQFRLFRTNGLLWSLAACSAIVPLIDRFVPGTRYSWAVSRAPTAAAAAARNVGTTDVEFENANRASRPLMESHT